MAHSLLIAGGTGGHICYLGYASMSALKGCTYHGQVQESFHASINGGVLENATLHFTFKKPKKIWKPLKLGRILHGSTGQRARDLTCKINLPKPWKMAEKVVYLLNIHPSTSAASDLY